MDRSSYNISSVLKRNNKPSESKYLSQTKPGVKKPVEKDSNSAKPVSSQKIASKSIKKEDLSFNSNGKTTLLREKVASSYQVDPFESQLKNDNFKNPISGITTKIPATKLQSDGHVVRDSIDYLVARKSDSKPGVELKTVP